jgi:hypothetical protein
LLIVYAAARWPTKLQTHLAEFFIHAKEHDRRAEMEKKATPASPAMARGLWHSYATMMN